MIAYKISIPCFTYSPSTVDIRLDKKLNLILAGFFLENLLNHTHLKELEHNGVLYFKGITPCSDWLDNLNALGSIISKDDSAIRVIKPDATSTKHSFSLSLDALNPHTEAPYLTRPPRYLVLHGVQPAACGGGLTSYCDGYALFNRLPDWQRESISTLKYEFPVMDNQGNTVKGGIKAPIMEPRAELPPLLRFSENLLRFGQYCTDDNSVLVSDVDSLALADWVSINYRQCLTLVPLAQGDILILDNYRMLHARTSFQDQQRFLEAVWIV